MTSIFSKEEKDDQQENGMRQKAETIIGPTVKVEGTFESDDNISIEGQVTGTVKTSKDLSIGKDASIEADITAANMYIAGEINGNLHASGTIKLTSSARIHGDIDTQIISVETGAVVQGKCMTGGSHPQKEKNSSQTVASESK